MAQYDLVVIGAGPGGLSAAKRAAAHGAKVAIAERSDVGGVCVNQGCIPKKLMVYAADSAQLVQNLTSYGWQASTGQFDWMSFMTSLHQEIERLRQVQEQSLKDAKIDIFNGYAKFVDAHTLQIAEQTVTAERVLIATGGKPIRPKAIAGIEHALTSDDMFRLTVQPQKIAIIGAGYIGVEFASILCGLDTEVILINQDDGILNGFDDDLRHAVQQGLLQRGITLLENTTTDAIEPFEQGVQLRFSGDRSNRPADILTAELVLCATGRSPNVENLGLENAGVEVKDGAIAVDDYSRTNQAHIFAVGDCTNRVPLTPVARAEGKAFADTVFGNCSTPMNYDFIPSAVFSRPEAAAVGMTEADARKTLGEVVECNKTQFRPLFHTFSDQDETAMIKLISDRSSQKILGVHMVGENAAEIVQGLTPALQQGITRLELEQAIGIHPSSGEEMFALA
jgi:glutathione reductase (NADPH)